MRACVTQNRFLPYCTCVTKSSGSSPSRPRVTRDELPVEKLQNSPLCGRFECICRYHLPCSPCGQSACVSSPLAAFASDEGEISPRGPRKGLGFVPFWGVLGAYSAGISLSSASYVLGVSYRCPAQRRKNADICHGQAGSPRPKVTWDTPDSASAARVCDP